MVNKRKAHVYQFSFKTLRSPGTLLKQGTRRDGIDGVLQDISNLQKIKIFCECLLLKKRINQLAFNIKPRSGSTATVSTGWDIIIWIPAYDTPSRVARDVNSFYKKVFEKGVMDCALNRDEYDEATDEAPHDGKLSRTFFVTDV